MTNERRQRRRERNRILTARSALHAQLVAVLQQGEQTGVEVTSAVPLWPLAPQCRLMTRCGAGWTEEGGGGGEWRMQIDLERNTTETDFDASPPAPAIASRMSSGSVAWVAVKPTSQRTGAARGRRSACLRCKIELARSEHHLSFCVRGHGARVARPP